MLIANGHARHRWWEELAAGADLPGLDELVSRPTWHRDAACRGKGPDLFFPDMGESPAPAKALCATCTVIEPCRSAGRTAGGGYGVWGGESATDRRRRVVGLSSDVA